MNDVDKAIYALEGRCEVCEQVGRHDITCRIGDVRFAELDARLPVNYISNELVDLKPFDSTFIGFDLSRVYQ